MCIRSVLHHKPVIADAYSIPESTLRAGQFDLVFDLVLVLKVDEFDPVLNTNGLNGTPVSRVRLHLAVPKR